MVQKGMTTTTWIKNDGTTMMESKSITRKMVHITGRPSSFLVVLEFSKSIP